MKAKLIVACTVSALVTAFAYWFVSWNLNRSFQKADWGALQALIEAPLGEVVTAKLVSQSGPGAIPYYQEHPGVLQRDKRYFQTWRSAVLIAASMQRRGQSADEWTSSTSIPWLPLSEKTDPWGHAFCIQSTPVRLVVVSPGPQALASMDCRTLELPESTLAKMTPARLNVDSSGALVFLVNDPKPEN